MFTAEEARNNYNPLLAIAEDYINEFLEPLIKKESVHKKFINIPATGYFCVGIAIDFPKNIKFKKPYEDVEVTKLILNILNKNGYKTSTDCPEGTEYQLGSGILTISWE